MRPDAHDPDALRSALESAGHRYTTQRQAIYDALVAADGHPTADDVFQGVRGRLPKISLATVYKALEAFASCGLVEKLAAGDGSARYDPRGDDHYHCRCLRSGRVEDLPTPYDPDLVARLDPGLADRLRDRGFRVTGYRLELLGYFDEAPAGAES
jgi:Fe2+ or Zn2+ uptake regulation protein